MWDALITDLVAVGVILTYVGILGCAVCTAWQIRKDRVAWRKK